MVFRLLLLLMLSLHVLHSESFYLPKETANALSSHYGDSAIERVRALTVLMNALVGTDDRQKLLQINNFFNAIAYASDQEVWNRSDYWANRMEFMGKGRGDCEDYTYAKYFTLKQLGIHPDKMRAFYCKSLTYGQPHMVLAYFKEGKKVPFILGNYNMRILPANKRKDLAPIKLYNSEALFIAKLKKMGKTVPKSKLETLDWLDAINGIRRKP